MISAVLMLLAAAPGPEEEPVRDVAIFTAPLAPVGVLVVSSFFTGGCCDSSPPMAFIPLGANFTAGEIEWAMDAAFVYSSPKNFAYGFTGFWFAVGPMIHTGHNALGGLFLNPKISVGAFRLSVSAFRQGDSATDQLMVNVTAGADFGYQFTVGRLYLAIVIGISAGAGWKEDDSLAGPWLNVSSPFKASDDLAPVLGLNLQLLRIGYTF